MSKEQKVREKAFKNISELADLISYLDSTNRRLQHTDYVYHYTTLGNAIKIIQSQRLFLRAAKDMNDVREYNNGDEKRWDNIFFSSFMLEDEESIGMWSMYAQPWKDGVKISIPKDPFKNWVKGTKVIHEISVADKLPTGRDIMVDEEQGISVHISAVAYSNSDSYKEKNSKKETLQCGGEKNTIIKNAVRIPELTGYIKDMAWSYEKEVRIKAEFGNSQHFQIVAIDIPDDIISAMEITASPKFEGNLNKRLMEEIPQVIKTGKSLFADMLRIDDACSKCEYRK